MHCRSPHPAARYWAKGSAIQFILYVLVAIVVVVIVAITVNSVAISTLGMPCSELTDSSYGVFIVASYCSGNPGCPWTSDHAVGELHDLGYRPAVESSGICTSSGVNIINGATCSSNSSCKSGVCRGGNCCGATGRSTGCTDCEASTRRGWAPADEGACSTCSSGYTLKENGCVWNTNITDGGSCQQNSQCKSGVCRGGICCGARGRSMGCTACDVTGDCSTCSSGYTLTSGQCSRWNGGSCSSSSQCTSGVCRGGNCCGSKGRSTGCTDCDSDGDCSTCSSGYLKERGSTYYNSGYQCVKSCGQEAGTNMSWSEYWHTHEQRCKAAGCAWTKVVTFCYPTCVDPNTCCQSSYHRCKP